MYIRKITRKNRDGSIVSYLQLAHNVRHPQKGYVKAEVIYNFGRQEDIDLAAIKRLVTSLCRFLSPEDALEATSALAGSGGDGRLRFVGSRPMGGAYLLRKLWEQIGIERVISRAVADREFTSPVEWAVFAMVANRALSPDSKLGMVEWMKEGVALGNEENIALQHLYRAMDVLLENEEQVQKEVFFSTASLLNLEVDLLFFDTTSTYFERDCEDEEEGALLRYGKSKDKRDDLPQIVIGLAVTKEGIPVRCWVLPGNTADASTVEMVQKDLAGWKLSRCVWVMDRGMAGEENRTILQRAGGHYILGEKLRDKQEANQAALSHPGRYRKVKENMEVKEIVVGDGERRRRFVLVYNPQEAQKDRATREKNLEKIRSSLEAMGDPRMRGHKKAACALLSHRTHGRYLREAGNGKIAIDMVKVRAEERLDGKYLLSTSDDSLSPEDVALGYKQLLQVERAFRTLKTTLELRPVHHRKEDRIRSHVLLCWLALHLVRVAERETGETWDTIRAKMERMHLGQFLGKDGKVLQRTELTQDQTNLLKKLKIPPPPLFRKIAATPENP
jgi:transposase